MAEYRIYFIGESAIRGRYDFDADDDQAAIQIAHVLFDACSENCQSYDLWQQSRRVAVPRLFKPGTFDELAAVHQERAIEVEEGIINSEWQMASRSRLLETRESISRDALAVLVAPHDRAALEQSLARAENYVLLSKDRVPRQRQIVLDLDGEAGGVL